jgi:hypothetical protein
MNYSYSVFMLIDFGCNIRNFYLRFEYKFSRILPKLQVFMKLFLYFTCMISLAF